MYIKEIKSQNRRDFTAIYKCEHCDHEESGYGYDDDYFHNTVIPNRQCTKCGEIGNGTKKPLTPKYEAHEVV